LLGRGRLHPALHADDRGVIVGRVSEAAEYQLVTSERDVIAPAEAKDVLLFTPRPYPDPAGRWSDADLSDFLVTGAPAALSDVLAIVNSGYKAGASVPRCEGKEQKRVESFAVYAPLALAAIRNVNPTTEDRCIPLILQRGTDRHRLNAEVDSKTPAFARIRAL